MYLYKRKCVYGISSLKRNEKCTRRNILLPHHIILCLPTSHITSPSYHIAASSYYIAPPDAIFYGPIVIYYCPTVLYCASQRHILRPHRNILEGVPGTVLGHFWSQKIVVPLSIKTSVHLFQTSKKSLPPFRTPKKILAPIFNFKNK